MKRSIAILLTILLLFSFSSCFAPDETTTPQDTTTAPEDTTSPQQDTTAPTTDEAAFPPPYILFNEEKFPTITSIKIRENDFDTAEPTDEELLNFLCEALMYYTSFFNRQGLYSIPVEEVYDASGRDWYKLDPEYAKSKEYLTAVVNSYLIPAPNYNISDVIDDTEFDGPQGPDKIYITFKYGSSSDHDTSLMNIIERRNYYDYEKSIYVKLAIYVEDLSLTEEGIDHDQHELLSYASIVGLVINQVQGKWKLQMDNINWHETAMRTPPRSDFGKRITIVKPD